MITPARVDLVAQRWSPFIDITAIEGFDLSAAVFMMHIRLYRDAPGDPIVELTNAAADVQGISVTVATVEIEGVETVVSSVQIRIDNSTIRDILLGGAGSGKDISLVYDLHITSSGIDNVRWMEGSFTIRAGATQNV